MSLFSHSLLAVALAGLIFTGGHFLLSHTLRQAVLARLGEGGFRGAYSAMAGLSLAWMIYAYSTAPYVELWSEPAGGRWIALILMLASVLFLVLGTMTPSPGQVGAERAQLDYAGGLGIHAIARHPGLCGFALWALAHAIVNGDAATLLLCASIGILAVGGMFGIDARKARAFPDAYGPFMAHTSILPFAALASGRVRLDLGKVGMARLALAVAIFALLLVLHGPLIGRAALPH
ncbi:MAG: NnrU protein [Alphaproteobacteria bacterium]|nr:NnrU protein [Alphaproteobacteria bacterium]